METENQNLIYDLTVRTKMNFTRFVLSPRRNPELLNSNEFHRDLGKQCRQFHYQGFAVFEKYFYYHGVHDYVII